MATAIKIATFPFRAVFRLVKLLVLPVLVVAVSWWLIGLGAAVFWVSGVLGVVWALVMVRLWKVQVSGQLRSLARGTVHIRRSRRPRRGDRW